MTSTCCDTNRDNIFSTPKPCYTPEFSVAGTGVGPLPSTLLQKSHQEHVPKKTLTSTKHAATRIDLAKDMVQIPDDPRNR